MVINVAKASTTGKTIQHNESPPNSKTKVDRLKKLVQLVSLLGQVLAPSGSARQLGQNEERSGNAGSMSETVVLSEQRDCRKKPRKIDLN